MTEKINLYDYSGFVDSVTSDASKDLAVFISRLQELNSQGLDVPRFLTAAIGMPDEAGEFAGYAKKILFHGKPLNEENRQLLLKELGDVAWYWVNACRALGIDPYDVLTENVNKLSSRYPGGFSAWLSENRKEGDV
jgi:hypothetical protein